MPCGSSNPTHPRNSCSPFGESRSRSQTAAIVDPRASTLISGRSPAIHAITVPMHPHFPVAPVSLCPSDRPAVGKMTCARQALSVKHAEWILRSASPAVASHRRLSMSARTEARPLPKNVFLIFRSKIRANRSIRLCAPRRRGLPEHVAGVPRHYFEHCIARYSRNKKYD